MERKIIDLIKIFEEDLKEICGDNEEMKKEIELYFNDKMKELNH